VSFQYIRHSRDKQQAVRYFLRQRIDKGRVRVYLTVRTYLTEAVMPKLLHCSFCGKSEKQIEKLVAGPGGLHICNECVETCQLVMHGDAQAAGRDFDPASWPTERLLAVLAPVNTTVEAHREHLQRIVDALRVRDISWAKIAEPLKISRQSAWERFGGQ
jgi:hypothetical protein